MSGKVTRSVAERLWEKADVRGAADCWNWQASKDGRNRYGLFYRDGRLMGAHVAAYELVNGTVPMGLEIDHACDNSICVNPAHLRPMTHRANNLRSGSLSADNARKDECLDGHSFSRENTRIDTRGARICRTCDNAKDRVRHAAKAGGTR